MIRRSFRPLEGPFWLVSLSSFTEKGSDARTASESLLIIETEETSRSIESD
jgi:hypothetical protein